MLSRLASVWRSSRALCGSFLSLSCASSGGRSRHFSCGLCGSQGRLRGSCGAPATSSRLAPLSYSARPSVTPRAKVSAPSRSLGLVCGYGHLLAATQRSPRSPPLPLFFSGDHGERALGSPLLQGGGWEFWRFHVVPGCLYMYRRHHFARDVVRVSRRQFGLHGQHWWLYMDFDT